MSRPFFLACDVFESELKKLGIAEEQLKWFPMGLHDHPAQLRETLREAIRETEQHLQPSHIVLLYGLCGNGVIGLTAEKAKLVIPQAHDCISVLLGGPERHQEILRRHPGSYFYSPGWIRNHRVPGPDREASLRILYAERYADDPEMIDELIEADKETFAHHDRAVYIDLQANRKAEEYCRRCAAHLHWDFVKATGDPALLQALASGHYEHPGILIVPPRHTLVASSEGLMKALPPG